MKTTLVAAVGGLLVSFSAHAIPVLQLYVEGGTYDTGSETWVFNGSGPFRLWTIGNLSGPGGAGSIYGVKLSVAYASSDSPTISLTPGTTGGYGGFTDPSTPISPTFVQTVTDGSSPTLYDGSSLPAHGVYGPGTTWSEYALGNFATADSPIGDFITAFPNASLTAQAQINVYTVSVAGTETVYFDLYDHVLAGNKIRCKFAPFSHDAEGSGTDLPEGGSTLALLGLALSALGIGRRLKQ